MKHYKWKQAVVLTTTDNIYSLSARGLSQQLKEDGSVVVLEVPPYVPGTFTDEILSGIKRSGYRVIIALAYEADIISVAELSCCYPRWAWLQIDKVGAGVPAMHGWLAFQPLMFFNQQTGGFTEESFADEVKEYSKSQFGLSSSEVNIAYAVSLHDAIMLYAHAATKVMLENGDLFDATTLTEALLNTSFEGLASDTVSLDNNGDRIQSYELMNYVAGADGGIASVSVGWYNSSLQHYQPSRVVVWPGNTTEVTVPLRLSHTLSPKLWRVGARGR